MVTVFVVKSSTKENGVILYCMTIVTTRVEVVDGLDAAQLSQKLGGLALSKGHDLKFEHPIG